MTALSVLGLAAGACFAYCGVIPAYHTWKAGRSIGVPILTAWLIFLGGIGMYTYLTLLTRTFNGVLAFNYFVETASWGIIVWYQYKPRKISKE